MTKRKVGSGDCIVKNESNFVKQLNIEVIKGHFHINYLIEHYKDINEAKSFWVKKNYR